MYKLKFILIACLFSNFAYGAINQTMLVKPSECSVSIKKQPLQRYIEKICILKVMSLKNEQETEFARYAIGELEIIEIIYADGDKEFLPINGQYKAHLPPFHKFTRIMYSNQITQFAGPYAEPEINEREFTLTPSPNSILYSTLAGESSNGQSFEAIMKMSSN